jgi:hypothetical protein
MEIMTLADAELIGRLNTEIAKLLHESLGDGFVLLRADPERIDRRYSFMFRYSFGENGEAPRSLLVKIPHQSWMKTIDEAVNSEQICAEVKFEYDILRSIARVIADSKESQLCALNPVGYLADLNALVTEEICLVMLKHKLTKVPVALGAQKAWDDFTVQLRLAGKWLQIIHTSFSRGKEVVLESLDLFGQVSMKFALLEEKNMGSLNPLQIKIKSLYDLISNEKIPMSAAHDDYQLGNIFVTNEGKVGVLDPNWKDDQPIYGDLSKLIIDPMTRKMQVALHGLSFRPSLQVTYEREILAGYFGDKLFSEAVLCFFCALAILEKWNSNEEILAGGKSRLISIFRPFLSIYIQHYFLRLIHSYLDRGIRAAA